MTVRAGHRRLHLPDGQLEGDKYFTVYQRADGSGRHVLALFSQISLRGRQHAGLRALLRRRFPHFRGFAFRGVGPVNNGFARAATSCSSTVLEYQLPAQGQRPDSTSSASWTPARSEARPEIKDYRVSAGFGARVVVPMLGPVPIALDFGFPIVKGPDDKEQVFSFWLGFYH